MRLDRGALRAARRGDPLREAPRRRGDPSAEIQAPPALSAKLQPIMASFSHIRNFSIIAHIDHGKSTLADRILQMTNTVAERDMREQVLDRMDLERERGITIKAQAVRIYYHAEDGQEYQFNLIDTPGHVDFTYEVSRSMAACEGVILVVDATQGVEAQTLANTLLALENDLEIVPVLNKIDLPGAEPEKRADEIVSVIGCARSDILQISAKTGEGVAAVLEAVVHMIPPPQGDPDGPPRALIFDSVYDQYQGVVAFVRVRDGSFRKNDALLAMATGRRSEIEEVGIFSARHAQDRRAPRRRSGLHHPRHQRGGRPAGGGYAHQRLSSRQRASPRLSGHHPDGVLRPVPHRWRGLPRAPRRAGETQAERWLSPLSSRRRPRLWDSDSAVGSWGCSTWRSSGSAWSGSSASTCWPPRPACSTRWSWSPARCSHISNPVDFPESGSIKEVREPYIAATILVPAEYVGPVMELCNDKRGRFEHMEYLTSDRVRLDYALPLAEIVLDFFDLLKTRSRGYASLDYELKDYEPGDLVRLDIRIANEIVDALSLIVHADRAYTIGRGLTEKLRKKIPRQMFEIAIQAAVGSPHHRAGERGRASQGRHRQVLRWRHQPQAQAARETEGRQEAHEDGGHSGDPARSLPGRSRPGRRERGEEMTVEFVVLGAILIVMGAVQTWLRHGPWGKELRAEQEEVAARRAERAQAAQDAAARAAARAEATAGTDAEADDDEDTEDYPAYDAIDAKVDRRAGKAWNAWTGVLGGIAMVGGVLLLVLGLLGY